LYEGNLATQEIETAKAGQQADYPAGIPECGTDALRFALCAYTSGGRDINLDILRVDGYRKFCNKLWNANRFAMMKLGDNFIPREDAKLTGNESLAEKWILNKFNKAAIETNKALEDRNFMAATNIIYNFWIYELCDVYIVSECGFIVHVSHPPTYTDFKLCHAIIIGTDQAHLRCQH
jgi:valyl-tRNA synthetase